jgi:hypothetical protein
MTRYIETDWISHVTYVAAVYKEYCPDVGFPDGVRFLNDVGLHGRSSSLSLYLDKLSLNGLKNSQVILIAGM